MQIRFEAQTKHGVFSDALNLEDDHTFTDAELEAMKSARVAAWVNRIDNPLPEPIVDESTLIAE